MALLTILHYPDPRLRIKAKPVLTVTAETRRLLAGMLETMYAAPGIGLAATQVGVDERLIVVDVSETGRRTTGLHQSGNPHPGRQRDDAGGLPVGARGV